MEQLLRSEQGAFRGLQEGVDRGLRLAGDLLDRERPVADRDAVVAEDLVDRDRQGVRPAADQERRLARHRPGEGHGDRRDHHEPGGIGRDHDQEARAAGPCLEAVDGGRERVGDDRPDDEGQHDRTREPEQGREPDHQEHDPPGRDLEARVHRRGAHGATLLG